MEPWIMENYNLFSQQDFKNMVEVGDITQADYDKIYGNQNQQNNQQNNESNTSQPAARPAHSQQLHNQSQQNSNFNTVD